MSAQAWVHLDKEDLRAMLVSLIGDRFGERPDEHLDEIREERARYAAKFIRLAGIGPSDHVLELGSGCGFGTSALAARACEVIACDISPAYLEFASNECSTLDNVKFLKITSRDLSAIENHSIDVVVSMAVFIHLNLYDIHLYFREFRRVLKPGGRVAIDFADMNRLFSRASIGSQDQLFLSHAEFYRKDPTAISGLMQWNSAPGIKGIARNAGLRFLKRRGHKLLFGH